MNCSAETKELLSVFWYLYDLVCNKHMVLSKWLQDQYHFYCSYRLY